MLGVATRSAIDRPGPAGEALCRHATDGQCRSPTTTPWERSAPNPGRRPAVMTLGWPTANDRRRRSRARGRPTAICLGPAEAAGRGMARRLVGFITSGPSSSRSWMIGRCRSSRGRRRCSPRDAGARARRLRQADHPRACSATYGGQVGDPRSARPTEASSTIAPAPERPCTGSSYFMQSQTPVRFDADRPRRNRPASRLVERLAPPPIPASLKAQSIRPYACTACGDHRGDRSPPRRRPRRDVASPPPSLIRATVLAPASASRSDGDDPGPLAREGPRPSPGRSRTPGPRDPAPPCPHARRHRVIVPRTPTPLSAPSSAPRSAAPPGVTPERGICPGPNRFSGVRLCKIVRNRRTWYLLEP